MLHDPHYRAIGYPYVLLEHSFVMDGGTHRQLLADDPQVSFEDRRPVIAVGSNMSPLQLARKFPDPDYGPIPVTRMRLKDFDSVYSTHFTTYGSIPATLFPSPGTTVTLFLTWLSPRQEERMHETETLSENYGFYRLDDIEMTVEHGPDALNQLFGYLSSRGAVAIEGEPVCLAEVPAEGRRWRSLDQTGIQQYARERFAPDSSLEDFIRENIENEPLRRTRTDVLHENAIPFERVGVERIDGFAT